MSIEVRALQRIAVTEEAAGSFAVDVTGSATYLDVPLQEGTAQVELLQDQLEPQTVQQYIDAYPTSVLGQSRARLTFTMPLHGLGQSNGNGATSELVEATALTWILAVVFGGWEDGKTGTTENGGASTASSIEVSANLSIPGQAVGWVDSSGTYHLHSHKSGDANTKNLRHELPSAPSASNEIYGVTTIHLAENPLTSLQFIVEGAEQSDRWLLMGGQSVAAPTITREIGQIPTITFTFEFAAWAQEPEQPITAASYANYDPIYVTGFVRSNLAATVTRNVIDAARVEYTLNGPIYVPVLSPSGTNGIVRWRRSRAVPFVEISFSVPYESYSTWMQERDDKDIYHWEDQLGTSAGSTVLIDVPCAQVWDAQPVDEGGLAYQQVTLRSQNDSVTDDQSTELERSAMRIHFG